MPEEDRRRFVENIRREAARTQELVDRLLELAALERQRHLDRIEPVSMLEIASAAVRATEPKAQRRRLSVILTAEADVHLRGDPLLLAGALTNLVENALDFSPEGGRVEIRIARVGDQAHLTVRDEGPGVPDYALGAY